MITEKILREIAPFAPKNIGVFVPYLNKYMQQFSINTINREAAFLAQLAHESGSFRYVREIASGAAYEGRKDLGNIHTGDGKFFKGRGLIQITGRNNYRDCSMALFGDNRLLQTPTLLECPEYAVASACWFWYSKGLNKLADSGKFEAITRRINGGLTGYADRLNFWEKAKEIITLPITI